MYNFVLNFIWLHKKSGKNLQFFLKNFALIGMMGDSGWGKVYGKPTIEKSSLGFFVVTHLLIIISKNIILTIID